MNQKQINDLLTDEELGHVLHVRISPRVKLYLEEVAKSRHESVGDVVRGIVREFIQEREFVRKRVEG